jgi:hypothetical protein
MYRRKARRTCGIDAIAWATKLEEIVDTAWSEGPISAGNEICINILSTVDFSPIITGHPVEDANPISLRRWSPIWYKAGLFKGFIGGDKGKTLARICLCCFSRGYTEEPSIKKSRFGDPAAVHNLACILSLPRWVVVFFRIKSILWNYSVDI